MSARARLFYALVKPFLSTQRARLPTQTLSTVDMDLAMLAVARHRAGKAVLETAGIRASSRWVPAAVLDLHAG